MALLESYLRELRAIRSSGAGVKETSYYTPLANLLNEVGKLLKPRVRCVMQLKNAGAGNPDGGLFTSDQIERGAELARVAAQLPARGAIEAKPTSASVRDVADSDQVRRYWERYSQVLVTNYRDFVLVDRAEFFARFDEGQAVQYFYEPFLEAFDPQLRKELGVWYTPPVIVRYMVEIERGASKLGLTLDQVLACLGDTTSDVYLNGVAYWRNVPSRVWAYTIGGYQVMKKWLSYRERELLGRPLTEDEVRYVTEMARRLAALRLLEPTLDANYEAVKTAAYSWPFPVTA